MNLFPLPDLTKRQAELATSAQAAVVERERLVRRAPAAVAKTLAIKVPDLSFDTLSADVVRRRAAAIREADACDRRRFWLVPWFAVLRFLYWLMGFWQ